MKKKINDLMIYIESDGVDIFNNKRLCEVFNDRNKRIFSEYVPNGTKHEAVYIGLTGKINFNLNEELLLSSRLCTFDNTSDFKIDKITEMLALEYECNKSEISVVTAL